MPSLRSRSPTRLAARVLVAGFADMALPRPLERALGRGLAGLILFKRNVDSVAAVAERLRAWSRLSPRLPLLSVDQEGGRVARLGAPLVRLPPMRELGRRGDPAWTARVGRLLGRQLRAVGFNVNFAPVLDVDSNPANPVIGDRSFSSDPRAVAAHGVAMAKGLAEGGVFACGKHFPGHGDTDTDSHTGLPCLHHDRARLEAVELIPFRAAAPHVDLIMSAHVVYPALSGALPATLSRAMVHDLLRRELGFRGVVVSDDLEMDAIAKASSVADAALDALMAGCDLMLICHRLDRLLEAEAQIDRAAERSPAVRARLEEAVARVDALRARLRPPGADGYGEAFTHEEVRAVERWLREGEPRG